MKTKSFTLIELLVVIVIIGILASVIVVSTSNNIQKAEDAKLKSTMLQISKSLKMYSLDSFPIESTPCNLKDGCTNLKSKIDLPKIDKDIYYKTSSNGTFFVLYSSKPSNNSLSFEINTNTEDVKEVPSFNNLVAYYPLSQNISSGTTISDMSPNSNHGTNHGASFREGVDGNTTSAMGFDGVDDYVDLDNNYVFTQNHSLSFLGKINMKDYQGIVGGNLGTFAYLRFGGGAGEYDNNIIGETNTDGDGIVLSFNNQINTDKWYHFVIIEDGSNTWRLYLDGALQTSMKTTTNSNLTIKRIGQGRLSTDYFNGQIKDIRMYLRHLCR